jgi:hypothetical protein
MRNGKLKIRSQVVTVVSLAIIVFSTGCWNRLLDVEVSDIILCSGRVAAKVTNHTSFALILPGFYVRVYSKPITDANCWEDICLAPGKSAYIVTGGMNYPLEAMNSPTRVEVTYNGDPTGWSNSYSETELKYLPQMKMTVISAKYSPILENCEINARFENRSGWAVTLVSGTAVFLV